MLRMRLMTPKAILSGVRASENCEASKAVSCAVAMVRPSNQWIFERKSAAESDDIALMHSCTIYGAQVDLCNVN